MKKVSFHLHITFLFRSPQMAVLMRSNLVLIVVSTHCSYKMRTTNMLHPKPQNPTLWTPLYYGQSALSLEKKSPDIFSKFNPLYTDTPLIWTLSMAPLVSALTGFDSLTVPRMLGGGSEACFVTCRDTYSYS